MRESVLKQRIVLLGGKDFFIFPYVAVRCAAVMNGDGDGDSGDLSLSCLQYVCVVVVVVVLHRK